MAVVCGSGVPAAEPTWAISAGDPAVIPVRQPRCLAKPTDPRNLPCSRRSSSVQLRRLRYDHNVLLLNFRLGLG
jgi:hypothetical protein